MRASGKRTVRRRQEKQKSAFQKVGTCVPDSGERHADLVDLEAPLCPESLSRHPALYPCWAMSVRWLRRNLVSAILALSSQRKATRSSQKGPQKKSFAAFGSSGIIMCPRIRATRPYFAGFKDEPGDVIDLGALALRSVSPGYMAVLCEGQRGQGFYICLDCGAGFKVPPDTHRTPYGQECHGRLQQLALGHQFLTDVLEVQFKSLAPADANPLWLGYSLAYALVEGAAEVLEVPSIDLSSTVSSVSEFPVPSVIL